MGGSLMAYRKMKSNALSIGVGQQIHEGMCRRSGDSRATWQAPHEGGEQIWVR